MSIAFGSNSCLLPHFCRQDLPLAEYPIAFRQQVTGKIEAFERFVNLNAIALGILQILCFCQIRFG